MTDSAPEPSATERAATERAAIERPTLMKAATYAAVTAAVTMIAMKLGAWFLTGSVAMLGSLVDSSLDAFASIINLIAVRHAITPADREHRFGHGKAEAIAGLAQGALIIGSALFLFAEAIRRFIDPVTIERGGIGITVIVISIVITLALVTFQTYVARKTRSVAINADSLHYKGDLLMNASVIVALVLSTYMGWLWADAVFGIAIAAFVAHAAAQIVRQSYDQLMDRELPDEDRERIVEEVFKCEEVIAIHDMKTRSSGGDSFIQLHMELDPGISLDRAHDISEEVEQALMALFPSAEVIIHQDPLGAVPEEYPGRVTRHMALRKGGVYAAHVA
jgi:ferrous-iron efflux pump FieF